MQLHDVIEGLRRIAPEHLAAEWDRVGLHLGDPEWDLGRALLCIDLTEPVLDEAEAHGAGLIVAYHPPIFAPLSALTTTGWKQRLILRAARAGIAVYSPHTALDSAAGGVTDFLAEAVEGATVPIVADPPGSTSTGMGRLVTLAAPIEPGDLADRFKRRLAGADIQLAAGERPITRLGVCPGAGGSLMEELTEVDAFFTGEMRHHRILDAQAEGVSVLLAGHTESERPYLPRYRDRLAEAIPGVEWRVSARDAAPGRLV